MSNKLIKVINNKDRYFNGARKGGILEVDKNRVNYYLQNGFSLVKEPGILEEKKNIVNEKKQDFPGVDNEITVVNLKEQLDHHGVDYSELRGKPAFQEALSKVLNPIEADSDDNNSDIEALKEELVNQAILTVEELEGKTDAEILEIAKTNGF